MAPKTLIGKFPGYELDRFMENSSNRQFYNLRSWHRPISGKLIQIWTSFPKIGPAHTPIFYKNWIGTHKKWWMNFPEIRLCHTPEKWNLGKVFQDLPIRVNRYYLEYAVLRLIGMSGLRLYKTAANEAVKISSYTPNTNRSQEQVLIKSSRTGTRVWFWHK